MQDEQYLVHLAIGIYVDDAALWSYKHKLMIYNLFIPGILFMRNFDLHITLIFKNEL